MAETEEQPQANADPLLEKVKVSLRTTTDDAGLLDEIAGLIAAARADLKTLGIVSDNFAEANAPLFTLAIQLFVKAHWGYDNPDAEKQMELYEQLKTELSIHSQYDRPGGEADAV